MSQQELELLAEWLGIKTKGGLNYGLVTTDGYVWNPSPEGNDTDFLNMVAGRVDIQWDEDTSVWAYYVDNPQIHWCAYFDNHNNDKLAAMKHAAYQVCLMAAREWKGGTVMPKSETPDFTCGRCNGSGYSSAAKESGDPQQIGVFYCPSCGGSGEQNIRKQMWEHRRDPANKKYYEQSDKEIMELLLSLKPQEAAR